MLLMKIASQLKASKRQSQANRPIWSFSQANEAAERFQMDSLFQAPYRQMQGNVQVDEPMV
jgi:hypothetical protein